MNRREALATFAASLIPTWHLRAPRIVAAPPIPLREFCDPNSTPFRWDYTSPFVQANRDEQLFTFATDCKVCLRVDANESHRGDEAAPRPPAASVLDWDYDKLRGWRPWPQQNHLLADNSPCPKCHGYGTADGKIGQECETCYGSGSENVGGWEFQRSIKCRSCRGHGIKGPFCSSCKGNAYGIFPGVQEIGDQLIGSEYDLKIRTHLRDVEYTFAPFHHRDGKVDRVAFRFDGGLGLLMPLRREEARESIRAALAGTR